MMDSESEAGGNTAAKTRPAPKMFRARARNQSRAASYTSRVYLYIVGALVVTYFDYVYTARAHKNPAQKKRGQRVISS